MTVGLEVEGLSVAGAAAEIVCDVSLSVRAGRPFTILGETGCGKSLLAQAIMGVLPEGLRAEGRIALNGERIDGLPLAGRRALWGRKLALLPQEPWLALDPSMRSGAQVAEAHRFLLRRPWQRAREAAQADLAALGLADAGRKWPHQLSGGMAQRVAFAAAQAGGAPVLIADEPTKGLDAERRDDVVRLLRKNVEHDGALLTITHDFHVARALSGDIAIMLDGRFVESGPAERVLTVPSHDYTKRLIAADPAVWPDPALNAIGDMVLRAEGIGKRRGGRSLFERLDIDLAAGEIVAVSGRSGCGKSTLGSVLLGLLRPDTGIVQRSKDKRREKYQKLYQDPPAAFSPHVSLRRSLLDLLALHRLSWSRVEALMLRLKLAATLLDRRPNQVSGGELQRFALLRLLLLDPAFIFADEPTSRLDLLTQKTTIALLQETAKSASAGILLVTHDPALAAKVARRHLSLSPRYDQAMQENTAMATAST